MSNEIATIGALQRVAAALFAAIIFATAPLSAALAATPKAGTPAASAKSEATPEKIQELMTLLADPKVRDWLEQESKAKAAQARESDGEDISISHASRRPSRCDPRAHRGARRRTSRSAEPIRARLCPRHAQTSVNTEGPRPCCISPSLSALGFGVEWLFRKATQRDPRAPRHAPVGDGEGPPAGASPLRFAFAVGLVAAFALGSVGPFLALDWAAAVARDGLRLSRRLSRRTGRDRRRPFPAGAASRAFPHYSDGYGGRSVLVPSTRLRSSACLLSAGCIVGLRSHSRLFARGTPARRLRARARSPRDRARSGLAPARRAPRGRAKRRHR